MAWKNLQRLFYVIVLSGVLFYIAGYTLSGIAVCITAIFIVTFLTSYLIQTDQAEDCLARDILVYVLSYLAVGITAFYESWVIGLLTVVVIIGGVCFFAVLGYCLARGFRSNARNGAPGVPNTPAGFNP